MSDYKVVRTRNAGVFAGDVESLTHDLSGVCCVMSNARRLWYWSGAASLSELAMRGVSKPEECKFPVAVTRVLLIGVIEVLDVTPEAKASIASVPEWSSH